MHDVENLHIGIYNNNSTSVVVAKTSDVGKNVTDSQVNKRVSYSVEVPCLYLYHENKYFKF